MCCEESKAGGAAVLQDRRREEAEAFLAELKARPELQKQCSRMLDWELAKDNVYPILLSTKGSRMLPEGLVSEKIMDLTVAYIIRENAGAEGCVSIRVSRTLLEHYGISRKELHETAMDNLKKDGYAFLELGQCLREMMGGCTAENRQGGLVEGKMYVLRNTSGMYGAAGILDKEFLRGSIGDMDCFILPSSVHETIFLAAGRKEWEQRDLDDMVAQINAAQVAVEEQLADHSYYYDAGTGEIRRYA